MKKLVLLTTIFCCGLNTFAAPARSAVCEDKVEVAVPKHYPFEFKREMPDVGGVQLLVENVGEPAHAQYRMTFAAACARSTDPQIPLNKSLPLREFNYLPVRQFVSVNFQKCSGTVRLTYCLPEPSKGQSKYTCLDQDFVLSEYCRP